MRKGSQIKQDNKKQRITVSDRSPLKGIYRVKNSSKMLNSKAKKQQSNAVSQNTSVKAAAAYHMKQQEKSDNKSRNTHKSNRNDYSSISAEYSPVGNASDQTSLKVDYFNNNDHKMDNEENLPRVENPSEIPEDKKREMKTNAAVLSYHQNTANTKARERAAMLQSKMQSDINFSRKDDLPVKSDETRRDTELRQKQKKSFYLSANKDTTEKTVHTAKERKSEQRQDEKEIAKADKKVYKLKKKAEMFEKNAKRESKLSSVIKNAESVAETYTELSAVTAKNTTGEAAADISLLPVKAAGREIIKNAAAKNGAADKIMTVADVYALAEKETQSADNIGEAASKTLTALPQSAVRNKITKTVTAAADNNFKKQQEKKRENLRKQIKKAETRAAALRAEALKRDNKINLYKSEHGITSKDNSVFANVKAVIKQFGEDFGKTHKVKSSAAVIAAAGAFVPIIVIFVVVILFITIFSWMIPHSAEQYNEEDDVWEMVDLEEEREILEGYLTYIQQYFDRKQLSVLEIVDYDFGGFEPDLYCYTPVQPAALSYYFTNIQYNIRTTSVKTWSWNSGHGESGSGSAVVSDNTEPFEVCQMRYFRFDKEHGEFYTTPDKAEYSRVYMTVSVDIEEYYNNLHEQNPHRYPKYTFENGVLSQGQDITDLQIIQKDADGNTVNIFNAYELIMNGELIPDIILSRYFPGSYVPNEGMTDGGTTTSSSYVGISQVNTEPQNVLLNLELDKHIWSLYEYGNKWIKLSEDCDFEHIIAMAAVLKWQEIESNAIDTSTYHFEITEADIDKCMEGIFEMYYSYRIAPCAAKKCHKENGSYSCCRPTSHKHLIGQVTNYEYNYGMDFVLRKVLKVPVPSHYSSEEEYNAAMRQYELDCDVYEIYCEYISNVLGTSTKLDDYENDKAAQQRLRKMHEAVHGKKPDAPTDVAVSVQYVLTEPDDCSDGQHYHRKVTITWNPPADSAVTGYNVYVYRRVGIRPYANVYQTSAAYYEFDERAFNGLTYRYIIVSAYNDLGESSAPPHNLKEEGVEVIYSMPELPT